MRIPMIMTWSSFLSRKASIRSAKWSLSSSSTPTIASSTSSYPSQSRCNPSIWLSHSGGTIQNDCKGRLESTHRSIRLWIFAMKRVKRRVLLVLRYWRRMDWLLIWRSIRVKLMTLLLCLHSFQRALRKRLATMIWKLVSFRPSRVV